MKTEFCWLLPFANRVFENIKIHRIHLKSQAPVIHWCLYYSGSSDYLNQPEYIT